MRGAKGPARPALALKARDAGFDVLTEAESCSRAVGAPRNNNPPPPAENLKGPGMKTARILPVNHFETDGLHGSVAASWPVCSGGALDAAMLVRMHKRLGQAE